MNRVKSLRRVAALTGVVAVALLSTVAPANADAVKAVFTGDDGGGEGVFVAKKGEKPGDVTHTALLGLKTDKGEELKTYCVDFTTPTYDDARYEEVPWASHDVKGSTFKDNAKKINWLLANSYPKLDPSALQAEITKAVPGAKFTHKLKDYESIAATQAAAWFFSDGMILDKDHPTEHGDDTKDNVLSVYNYLTGDKNVGLGEQPKPELTLAPKTLAGKPGTLIGPFTVSTNAPDVVVSAKLPQGVTLTDKDGNALPDANAAAKKAKAAAQDKYDFFVKVPADAADGKADITVTGKASLTAGRLFAVTKGKPAQRLILADAQQVSLETTGVATWNKGGTTTPPTTDTTPAQPKDTSNELANTGASIMTPVLIGVVLVAGGVGALIFQRRRRNS